MPKVLVIDDDPAVALVVKAALDATNLEVVATLTAASGLSTVARERPAVVVLDVLLPDQVGLSALVEIRRRDPSLPVVVITGRGANEHAIDALRLGAHDFLFKPLKPAEVRHALVEAASRAVWPTTTETRPPRKDTLETSLLAGQSRAMQQTFKQIGRAAALSSPVLIRGENGAGKEAAARSIHRHSRNASGRFVAFPCAHECSAEVAALLFGPDGRSGALAEAAGGTLFLDDVAALPISVQGQWISRLESPSELRVRLVAATTQELEPLVAARRFRADLCYALAGCQVYVPPLRERLEDLPELVQALLERLCLSAGRKAPRATPETLARLAAYAWPGNVRELACVLQQALLQTTGPEVVVQSLAAFANAALAKGAVSPAAQPPAGPMASDWQALVSTWLAQEADEVYTHAVGECERQVLSLVLRHTGGNQARAAKILGITRSSLRLKLRGLGLVIDRQIEVRDGQP
jgi:two-component system nitrogen regulation response regulator GlnG